MLAEIRAVRAHVTAEETWWQTQPVGTTRTDAFRRINFWRQVLRTAEHRLRDGRADVGGNRDGDEE